MSEASVDIGLVLDYSTISCPRWRTCKGGGEGGLEIMTMRGKGVGIGIEWKRSWGKE